MVDPIETLTGNTEATATGIEATEPGMPCAVTKRETQAGTPSETTLDIPIPKIPVTPDLSSTPRNMNVFRQEYMLVLKTILCWVHQ